MTAVERTLSALAKGLLYLAALALLLMATFVVLSSVMRYFIGAPFRFTEELVGLLFAAMAFLVWPFSALRRRHVRVTVLSDRLPEPLRRIADLASAVFVIVFCIVFGFDSFDFAAFSYKIKALSDASGLILFPWMGLMPLAVVLLGIITVVVELRRQPVHDDEEIEDFLT